MVGVRFNIFIQLEVSGSRQERIVIVCCSIVTLLAEYTATSARTTC